MLIKTKFYIDGNWIEPEKNNELEVINPSNEKPCAIISLGSQLDTDKAVKSARKSFNNWWHTSREEKSMLLNKLLDVYKKRFSDMAEAISIEMGAPIDWATEQQSQSGEDHIKNFIKTFADFNFGLSISAV